MLVIQQVTPRAWPACVAAQGETRTSVTGLDASNATFAVGLVAALAIGILFGLLGALIGEVHQRIFYAHASTHFDPPAASIVVTTLIIALLAAAEVFTWGVWIPGTT